MRLINTQQPQAKIIVLVCKSSIFGAFVCFLIRWKRSIMRRAVVACWLLLREINWQRLGARVQAGGRCQRAEWC